MRRFLHQLNVVLVCATAFAFGARRVMLEPDEVYFFAHVGMGDAIVVIMGIAQLAAMGLVIVPRTRVPGALVTTALFAVTTGIYLYTDRIVYGLVSCIPLLMAGWVAHESVEVPEET